MKCTCGHVMTLDAQSKDEAVTKFKQMMDQTALDAHWMEKHQGDTMPKPTLEQSHMMIEQIVVEGDLSVGHDQPMQAAA